MKSILFFILVVSLAACRPHPKADVSHSKSMLTPSLASEIETQFRSRDINGCFILHDLEQDTTLFYNPDRAGELFLPASTFKILNSLIALECKVVRDENEMFKWDGKKRQIDSWNQDHNMKTGFKNSVVWLYQEIARRIGKDRMQAYVDSAKYGNMQIGNNIDDFWLVGDLRISPNQQVEFLKLLIKEDLPFQHKNISIVKKIMEEDKGDRYIFRAKTGWADYGTPVGWYVGYLELENKTYIFVNNLEIKKNEDARARKEITREIFKTAFDIDLNI